MLKIRLLSLFIPLSICLNIQAQKTVVAIKGNQFYINGKPTYGISGDKVLNLLSSLL